MPDVSALKKSNFLSKSDIGPNGSLFTVVRCEQVDVAKEGAKPEMKYALILSETEKPFILNSTNGQIIAQFTGRNNTDDWGGVKIVIYFDPNVSFGGKLVGGLRVRAPRNQAAAHPLPRAAAPAAPTNEEDAPY